MTDAEIVGVSIVCTIAGIALVLVILAFTKRFDDV